jgi:RNA polymerase sigma-70 factor (sigma-E family)
MQEAIEAEYVEYVTARMTALRRLAFLLCGGDDHRGDDLVQQTITRLYERWQRIRTVEHLDQYVRTMLVRSFLDERRSIWSRVQLFGALPDRRAAEESSVEDREVLRAALARVPRRQQAVLVLRFLCDQSVADVAAILGITEGTVKSQTSHGLAALRRELGEQPLAGQRRGT